MNTRMLIFLLAALGLAGPAHSAHEHEGAGATVLVLMFDGVQIIDFAAPYEVFGQAGFNVHTVSANGEPVTTAMGLSVNVDRAFEDVPDADIILVPGGDTRAVRLDRPTLEWLRRHSDSADQVLSVCTGSSILADAGLLDGGRATTFHGAFDSFEENYPDVTLVRDQRWVDNGKVVTSAGLASGIDAALHVVAERLGERKARSVALHLEYEWAPEQGFIRGLMADRHLRWPEKDLDWPEGSVIETVLALGDEEQWEIEYRIDSAWSPTDLMARLVDLARTDPALTLIETQSPLAAAWQHDSPHGGRWAVRVKAESPGDDGSYRAHVTVEPKPERISEAR